jgi:hypothetical protein
MRACQRTLSPVRFQTTSWQRELHAGSCHPDPPDATGTARYPRAMRSRTIVALVIGACGSQAPAPPPIRWEPLREIATGGGERGPWRQNDSRFDHVDDPSVAFDASGAAVVAWVDHRPKDVLVQIYERDGTPRLAQPVNVSNTPAVFSWLPRLVVSPVHPGDVFILWQEIIFSGGSHGGDILFARSLDGGATFEAARNLSSSIGGDGKGRLSEKSWLNGSLDLAIAADGALYAAWTEYDGQLWFTRSTDRGASFAPPLQIAGDPARPARGPTIASHASAVHLAWTTGEDASADIRFATSRDGGATFEPAVLVATTAGYSDAPKLVADRNGTLHLVHAESAGGPLDRYHVRYARSRDGRRFEPARALSRGDDGAGFPSLAIDDRGAVHVVWEVYPDHREPPRGLAIAISRDGGETFSAPAVVPGSADPIGGGNGSFQGRLMRKLAVRGDTLAIVNSSLALGRSSRVWLMRGQLAGGR